MKRSIANELDTIELRVMNGLKDFQRATVERIDELYRPPHSQKRVLVSDEVGLGKTLIARGVIAKFAKMRKEQEDDLVKVVYICSNGAIAEQNLNKLRISKELRADSTDSSRLSMQHLNIFEQESDETVLERYIQLIPLTPETSFRMTSGAGTVKERALMFAILKRVPELDEYKRKIEKLLRKPAPKAWDGWCRKEYEDRVKACNKKSGGKYLEHMIKEVSKAIDQKGKDGARLIDVLTDYFDAKDNREEPKLKDGDLISKLRVMFAKISIDKLEPDIVIMDEFQRFRFLLNADPESDTGLLVHEFFHSRDVHMLLLSATPYKMYSTLEEIDESQVDEHYSEFLDVMHFLNEDSSTDEDFRTIWSDYSIKLREMSRGDTSILLAKDAAEDAMYNSVCRTERISAKEAADIIDDHDVREPVEVLEQDVKSYLQAQSLLENIGANFSVPVDYIKSTPYIMSFMRDYQLKRYVEKYFSDHPDELALINKDTFWLKYNAINRYDKIPNNNARVERVMSEVLQKGAEKLLWVPPAKPYYEFEGAYKQLPDFSKTLVFSSWEMVPRMIACLFSYEVERLTVGALAKANREKEALYFRNGKKPYPAPRMNFKLRDDEPAAMNLLCLIYPSTFLSECYDPIECMNRHMTLREIEAEIREKIKSQLNKFEAPEGGQPDRRWYYLFPMLMDDEAYVRTWLNSWTVLKSTDEGIGRGEQKGFLTHIDKLGQYYEETLEAGAGNLGKMPDDLVDVLTDVSIASPAVCINRTYSRYQDDDKSFEKYLPSQVARIFINKMNMPESTAAVELVCGKRNEDAHWLNVLKYSKQGNLQAMFDEYAHIIASGQDNDGLLIKRMHREITSSMDIRTTPYNVDMFGNFRARVTGEGSSWAANMRSHYAVAFTKGEGKESDNERKKTIRNAFNSPFRPFILASTSIGQEGLDFHNYCRRIVHWNLPSNPIDLEQREGRINRFKCLAIRQNVAKRYGDIEFENDVWDELFSEAEKREKEKAGGGSDLIPYWGLTEEPDMIKIERLVPMYPFSRDELSYERLIKILSLYRLTLGQARQEELLEYLFDNFKGEDAQELNRLFINLSPYYKQHSGGRNGD